MSLNRFLNFLLLDYLALALVTLGFIIGVLWLVFGAIEWLGHNLG